MLRLMYLKERPAYTEIYFEFRATISIIESHWFKPATGTRAYEYVVGFVKLSSKLRDARGLDEWSVQRKPVPTF